MEVVSTGKLPKHIGIIMDGNGRWARQRGLPRQAGHVTGARVFRRIVKHCEKRGIRYLTVYAFSTENWKRPQAEIDAIMTLLRDYLKESLADFEKENIRTRFIGDRRPLAPDIQELMARAEASTAYKTGMTSTSRSTTEDGTRSSTRSGGWRGMSRRAACLPTRSTARSWRTGSIRPDSRTRI